MKKIENIEIKALDYMPYDHVFDVAEGITELCHATGYKVKFPDDNHWWNEYISSEGKYFYGN